MDWRPLDSILFDEDNSSASILTTCLMAMDVHNVINIYAHKVLPIDAEEGIIFVIDFDL